MDAGRAVGRAAMSVTIDLPIDSIAAGGDGVGRHEGMVVFVPRTAPGDRARVCADRHDRLMRGHVLEILAASPLRTTPPCEHYTSDHCGGCQIQHLQYRAQLHAKSVIIRDAMVRIGKVAADEPEVIESDAPWRYRRKLTLALRRSAGATAGWIAGLHRYDAPDDVFALRDCPITQESVVSTWASVMQQAHLLPDRPSLRGAVRAFEHGFSFTLEGGTTWPAHTQFFAAVPALTELWWKPEGKSRRLLQSRGSDAAGASFTQVNPAVAAKLRACVVALAAAHHPSTAVDAYAGTGDIAVALAAAGARVTAIEIDRDAARVCASRLPPGSHAVAAAVEAALPRALPADVIVVNPPRAGLDARVAELLARPEPRPPRALIYVSCNPATLARDLRRLSGYRVASLRGFDMFPQTAHVETVCELVPAA
jgi:23S rRNA (uracil1939-C5)-methyltransferase